MKNDKQKLVIIAGPTAVGKSKFAVRLAKEINGEIICADSTTVYTGLDIGSAKVSSDEMDGIKHHLINIADINENYDVTDFKRDATNAINEIYDKGKIPILVGGSGFYIQSILYDIDFCDENEEKKQKIRDDFQTIIDKNGKDKAVEIFFEELKKVDLESAKKIDKNNLKRVMRAVEFFKLHDEPISIHNEREKSKKPKYNYFFYVLCLNRDKLYDRINKRVDNMVAEGLLLEIKKLIISGAKKDSDAMQSIGYKELYDYVYENKSDEVELEKCITLIKQHSRNYAKRQITWFKNRSDAKRIYMDNYINYL